ncbi:hypothetical protein E1B28_007380 [Marasmius oreades]|uniref:Uncharacterized protein n=1 Tax=Marasmius oreades TaxID=181124 RepID=A0A9P7S230_9AGAR|nr:uncharacterized protein E1B28_007380 [Marasmius oreades]KAG7093728.1 hypothetical protein E1B28_007380 [Marasmius oreades]
MNSGSVSPNPWRDEESPSKPQVLRVPSLDVTATASDGATKRSQEKPHTIQYTPEQDILVEFDPLASQEETDARKAWENSEGRPLLPPPVPSKDDDEREVNDTGKTKETSQDAPGGSLPSQQGIVHPSPLSSQQSVANELTSTSAFPSLAALARSFSIPSLPRPTRPVSLDAAKSVPSPNTLSRFAEQQGDASTATGATDSENKKQKQKESGADDGGESRAEEGESSRQQFSGTTARGDDTNGDPPFDFQKFLDQMKTRSAEPVARYLNSFLGNFAKRTFTTHDQIKVIGDFLSFIAKHMRECDIWRIASDAEFDNAMEGMEKLIMNQLYQFTFTPAIAQGSSRRQITTDDLERDRVLQQRIALFGWLEEKHLDIPEGEGSKGFLMFAEQELLKINHYKAPRDKLICILNCCKVIFGLIRHLRKEEGADSFVPILIFVVLKANPENLLSNVEYINRFRNPEKLLSEAGYYLSSLMGAVAFIETMDHTSLSSITQEEFERNVEDAIQNLPPSSPYPSVNSPPRGSSLSSSSSSSSHAGEESAQPLSLPAPPPPPGQPSPAQMISEDARKLLQKTGDTISKPLNAISRIFNEALDTLESTTSNNPSGRATPTQGNSGGRFASYLPGPFAPFELGKEGKGEGGGGFPIPWNHPDEVKRHVQSVSLPVSRTASPGVPQTPANAEGLPPPPIQTPYKQRVRRVPSPSGSGSWPGSPTSPGYSVAETPSRPAKGHGATGPYTNSPLTIGPSQPYLGHGEGISRTPTPSLDLAGMQAEIDAAHEQAAVAARETLTQIFPSMDKEILELVLEANNGDVGKSIDRLLEMSAGD